MRTFLAAMCPAFFIRVRPASTCMNMTSTAATEQTQDREMRRSALFTGAPPPLGSRLSCCAPRSRAGRSRRDRRRRFSLPSAALTIASTKTVLDDEDEERLAGEEARLEDPAAVLVRDAPLAAVADRLEDGHTDVTGLRLDRVDDRLLMTTASTLTTAPPLEPTRGLMPPRRPRPAAVVDEHYDDRSAGRDAPAQALGHHR